MFLATTAIEEFWDKNEELLFLGTWCLRYERRHAWESLIYRVLPSPWDDRERYYEAARYLDNLGEKMLSQLAQYLNSTHSVNHGLRYWRILIGPWLLHCLHVFYDRYTLLVDAFDKFPDLQTLLLDRIQYQIPKDTLEFVNLAGDDRYNLQIFGELLEGMDFKFPARALEYGSAPANFPTSRQNWGAGLTWLVKDRLVSFANGLAKAMGPQAEIGLADISVSPPWVWRLVWKSRFMAVPLNLSADWIGNTKVSLTGESDPRKRLAELSVSDEFEKLFVKCLPQNFPQLYLETYNQARTEIRTRYPHVPRIIVSSSDWAFNEPFKFLAAEAVLMNRHLIAMQHGGGYGIFRYSAFELHERRVADKFVAWGWIGNQEENQCNLPSPKVSISLGRFRKPAPGRSLILYLATDHPRYLYRFHSMPVGSQWTEYFIWQRRFLAALPKPMLSNLIFRPSLYDHGHALNERLVEIFPTLRWDFGGQLYQKLNESHLVVIDNEATTFLETLALNIPTVLFWNPNLWEVRNEAELYFDKLRQVGILWDSPEVAAAKLTQVYEEPWVWWGSEAVQEARVTFVERYAFARRDWIGCWISAMRGQIALEHNRCIHGHQKTDAPVAPCEGLEYRESGFTVKRN